MERCLRHFCLYVSLSKTITAIATDVLGVSQLGAHDPNYCNDTEAQAAAGLTRSGLGQFVGYDCSVEFFHCRWQSDGYYTYMRQCKPGLVFDTKGTQNCNFEHNVRGCSLNNFASEVCTEEEFSCPLSEMCVPMTQRCDGTYQCLLEEDEQNCPLCHANQFPCIISEQCIAIEERCNGIAECNDGTDERNCTGDNAWDIHRGVTIRKKKILRKKSASTKPDLPMVTRYCMIVVTIYTLLNFMISL